MPPPRTQAPGTVALRMPAEWHAHEATWLAWPHNEIHWPGLLERVQKTYEKIIAALLRSESVCLLVNDASMRKDVMRRLKACGLKTEHIHFFIIPTEDVWIRDYGPTFVWDLAHAGRVAAVTWQFNAWGQKYRDLKRDAAVGAQIPRMLNVKSYSAGCILEGGSIDVNGLGLCLTTRQCLLHSNRGLKRTPADMNRVLSQQLGVDEVIWLEGGILGDDTDGHVDDVARFVSPDRIVYCREENPKDANYDILRQNESILKKASLQKSRRLELIALPMPRAVWDEDERTPASYANFYIANKVVLVPQFDDPLDQRALKLFQKVFRGKDVVGIDSGTLICGRGGLHCVTQQQIKEG